MGGLALHTGIGIRPACPSDLSIVVEFMLHFYPSMRPAREFAALYYQWKYFDLAGRDTGHPAAFIAEDTDGIVGFMGCLPFRLQYDGQSYPAGWIADWRVKERGRGLGIGRMLLRTGLESVPALACLNGSEDAQRVFRDHGFHSWETARSWVSVCHPIAYEWPRCKGPKRALALIRSATHLMKSLASKGDGQAAFALCLESSSSTEPVDELAPTRCHNGMIRDGGYLGWLTRCPEAVTTLRLISKSGARIGYVLMQVGRDSANRQRGRILDLFVVPAHRDGVPEAYRLSSQYMVQSWGADYIDCKAPLSLSRSLERTGFQPRGTDRLWLNTRAFAARTDAEWLVSLVDKDNAFRGLGAIP